MQVFPADPYGRPEQRRGGRSFGRPPSASSSLTRVTFRVERDHLCAREAELSNESADRLFHSIDFRSIGLQAFQLCRMSLQHLGTTEVDVVLCTFHVSRCQLIPHDACPFCPL